MRLLRLDLLRYGHLADAALDFPPEARLHVVLGPNEAGKSTALSAIGDALFGFEHRTRFAFQFDTTQLRLGFAVESSDGTRESYLRLKRNKNALLDAREQPVPEAALVRMLGGATRPLFETTYGLNGETLRKGALALLSSGGEAGESLLAGMGLQNLHRAVTQLDEQAKALAGSRKHNQALTVAIERYKEARDKAEAASVRPSAWAATDRELQEVRRELAEARAEAAALREEESRLRRAWLVRPTLARLDALRAEQAGLADAPALPADAAATLDRLRTALRQAEEDARRETAEAERLEAESARLPRDETVLREAAAVDDLAARRSAVTEAMRDLPGVERKVAGYRAQVAEAAAQLGASVPPEALRDAVPPQATRQKASRLLTRRTELGAALAGAEAAMASAIRRRDAAVAKLDATATPPASAPLRRAIAAARAEGPLDREHAQAERRLTEARAQTTAGLAALPLWSGDATALAALRLPLDPATAEAAEALAAAEAALHAARDAAAQLESEATRLEGELAALARGETVPTREVVAAARARRDAAWQALRGALGSGAPADAGAVTGFEELRDEADRLADARAEDAQRVTAYAERQARRRWLLDQRGPAAAAVAGAEAGLAEARAAWAALWAPAGLAPGTPAVMEAWCRRRTDVLRLGALEAEAAQRRDEIAARIAAARQAILALRPETAAPTLAGLLDRAEEACAALEAAERARKELAAQAGQEAARAEEARQARDEAAARLAALDAEWRAALAALALDPAATAEAAEAALEAWGRIAEAATAWRGDAQRVADMQAAIAAFAEALDSLQRRTGAAPDPGEAPTLAAARLAQRLGQAREAAREAASLDRQARERRAEAEAATRRAAAAERELAALRALAGAADLPSLEQAIARSARRTSLAREIAELAQELLRQGDGLEEATLRAQAAAVDPDAARARLDEIEAGDVARAERLTALGARQQEVQARLAAMERAGDAVAHAQDSRQHLVAAQEAAERYARLHVARALLQAGIERLRQERQGPLLRAASDHFALLTGGRYPRLETDETEGGQTVLRAIRANGTTCPLESLSEGTRDQLYLALRVAAVEAHAEGAEPLPFIADDLLATFDDTRAAAALALLARLGERVQVVLFTHHAHVLDLAASLPGVSVQRLPEAAAPALVPGPALPAA